MAEEMYEPEPEDDVPYDPEDDIAEIYHRVFEIERALGLDGDVGWREHRVVPHSVITVNVCAQPVVPVRGPHGWWTVGTRG